MTKTRFATRLEHRLEAASADGKLENLHGVVVADAGGVVFERYFRGADERWGDPLGVVDFSPDTLHDLRSVTKSVVGLLYGIALGEGRVPALDVPLVDAIPRLSDLADDPERARITVSDALTMTLGLEWDESLPYTDPRNSEIAMESSPDRCRYVLERPIVAAPGAEWTYSGGASALLACLITDGTGMSLLEYARLKLFEPLGIEAVDWVKGADGNEVAASGLRLRPRDLARIGQLVLNRGRYAGASLIAEDWLEASFAPHAHVDHDFAYGYQWWIAKRWHWVAAFGNGGQRLTILPRAGLALVVVAGNYNSPTAWQVPAAVLVDVVVPALEP